MTYDWDTLVARLRKYPADYHHFLAPCPQHRIADAGKQLGTMPAILKQMLENFNGAELFVDACGGGAMLSLFGLTTVPPLPPLEWGEDWYIDRFTPHWRAAGTDRDDDWAIGMENYGGLILFNESRGISEWGTSERGWLLENVVFGDWIEKVIADGETVMAELNQDKSL